MLYNYFSIAQNGQKMKTKRKTKVIRSNKPYYITAAVIAGIALIFPMYSLFWLIVTAAVGVIVFLAVKKKHPNTEMLIESEPEYDTGLEELDRALHEAWSHLKSLQQLEEAIYNDTVRTSVSRMVKSCRAILSELGEHPKKAFKIRKFLNHYLPTTDKLMVSYKKQELLNSGGSNSDEIMRSVESNCGTMARAFETTLDSMFSEDVLDINTDIEVLDGIMDSGEKK